MLLQQFEVNQRFDVNQQFITSDRGQRMVWRLSVCGWTCWQQLPDSKFHRRQQGDQCKCGIADLADSVLARQRCQVQADASLFFRRESHSVHCMRLLRPVGTTSGVSACFPCLQGEAVFSYRS